MRRAELDSGVGSRVQALPPTKGGSMTDTRPVALVCRLDALDAADRARHAALRAQLDAAVEAVDELPDGYALRCRADAAVFTSTAEWITLERRCCPFLDFALAWSGAGAH